MTGAPQQPRTFLEDAARQRAAEVVATIESKSAAEVVVCARAASGDYRHADYLWGLLLAVVFLQVLLYLPQEIPLEVFTLGAVAGFLVGAFASRKLPGLRRLFTRGAEREANVRTAAEAAFTRLGVFRTSRRTGILVFVSLLEKRVEVIADAGVDATAMGAEWKEALEALSATVARTPDPAPFFDTLLKLDAPLARVLPRLDDDVNELPDMPEAVA